MKKIIIAIFIFILIGNVVASATKSEYDNQTIEMYMGNALKEYNIPGASMAVFKDNKVIYRGNWGYKSDGTPITSDSPFIIGSLSKPITALATMILVEEGKIKLDEPIETYIPWFKYQSKNMKSIKILNLLDHTSSISSSDGFKVTDRKYTKDDAIKEAASSLSGIKLNHTPGEKYEYTSANYLLLGAVIEEVSREPFDEFVKKNVFIPLGMDNTEANYESALKKGLKSGYQSWFGKPVKWDGFYDNSGAPYGYMVSTANDLIKFLEFMVNGGSLISEQSLKLLKSPPAIDRSYGLGWFYSDDDNHFYHGGATPDFRTEMFYGPETGVAAILLTNKYNTFEDHQVSNIMKDVRSIIYEDITPELEKHDYMIMWTMLAVTLVSGIASIYNIIRLKRKATIKRSTSIIKVIVSTLIAITLIPALSYFFGTPWYTISLFAPDFAVLIICLIAILVTNSVFTLIVLKSNQRFKE